MENEEMMMQEQQPDPQAEAGRGTDSVMAHLSLGEIVIPRAVQDDPEVQAMLQEIFARAGVDINEFTVGHEANKINPETGYPEFFLKKLFRKVSNFVLPQLGVVGGAANGLIQGQGLKGALKGGLQGGLNAVASIAGQTLLPMAGTYLSSALGNTFGAAAGTPLAGGVGPTLGTGINGAINTAGRTLGSAGSTISGLVGGSGGGSSFGGNGVGQGLSSAIGGVFQDRAIKKAQEAQLRAQQEQLANIGTFDPSNVTSDAGYQFNLAEGRRGLDRSAAAAGGLQSGAALKAAAQYNQQYADNALNSAYSRYSDKTNAQNAVYGNQGNTRAQYGLAGAENIARTASGIFNPQPSIEDLLRLYGRA
jgi:hypothetical protein